VNDELYLKEAIALAGRGLFRTDPNPRVGCVLVRSGRIVGRGWHRFAGGPHAEVAALQEAGDNARGATAYVSLEPCVHHGRTPPCTEALVAAGVTRVVAAMPDPDPRVSGQGLSWLRTVGLQAELHAGLSRQAEEVNPGYLRRIAEGLPWTRVKLAASVDARTAAASGTSRWITGKAARDDVQGWRSRSSAIVTGSGTVMADDPHLGLRLSEYLVQPDPNWPLDLRQPLRVVLDRRGRVPHRARIFTTAGRSAWLTESGVAALPGVLVPDAPQEGWIPQAVLRWLAASGCNEVLVEAGPRLAGAFLASGLVDELVLYMAPSLLGSAGAPLAWLEDLYEMDDRIALEFVSVQGLGEDLRIVARLPDAAAKAGVAGGPAQEG